MATLRHVRNEAPPARLTAAEEAILRSVVYASLFDYPLTLAQLRQSLIESRQTPSEILATYAGSEALQRAIAFQGGFFYLRGRDGLVAERTRREARSREFLRRHHLLLALVASLPYVRMVALSGSVAHLNLDHAGDLDLFVITRGSRVWSVTVAIVLLAKVLGLRRTLCANFVIADRCLELEQRDLFTASQIIHLQPVAGMGVYRRLLAANPFVSRYYPNFHPPLTAPLAFRAGPGLRAAKRILEGVLLLPSWAAEQAARLLYRRHLLSRSASWRSPDQVRLEPECLKLHTQSHRASVLERFGRAMELTLREAGVTVPTFRPSPLP